NFFCRSSSELGGGVGSPSGFLLLPKASRNELPCSFGFGSASGRFSGGGRSSSFFRAGGEPGGAPPSRWGGVGARSAREANPDQNHRPSATARPPPRMIQGTADHAAASPVPASCCAGGSLGPIRLLAFRPRLRFFIENPRQWRYESQDRGPS